MVAKAVTVMLATKLNWFTINHHTGQNGTSKFIIKMVRTTYEDVGSDMGTLEESLKNTIGTVPPSHSDTLHEIDERLHCLLLYLPCSTPESEVFDDLELEIIDLESS